MLHLFLPPSTFPLVYTVFYPPFSPSPTNPSIRSLLLPSPSLSLSTTFGGSPVSAVSPLALLVANINTLLAQFLFVFLSGAVFARMSQPSNPITFSKKAIIREGDYEPYNPSAPASTSAAPGMSSSPSISVSGMSFRSNMSSGSSVPESLGDSEEGYR